MRPVAELASAPAAYAHAVNGTAAAAHSPWQSPVPYLFGGLAAMLGLIAFALLILACSYWKLSGYLDGGSGNGGQAAGSAAAAAAAEGAEGEKGSAAGVARPALGFREHVVVIMAGDERPTFLAMPATSRPAVELGATPVASSCGCSHSEEEKKVEEVSSPPPPSERDADDDAASRRHESSSNTRQQESSQ
uniref:Protein GLUTAMINE DUMPER 3 n=1 Tax=Oryza meridionalis TaxID=40149 RepID=A0A0E0E4K8_9ORYZ